MAKVIARWSAGILFLAIAVLQPVQTGNAQQPVEEVVVRAFGHCGSWPVHHKGVLNCHFAEIKEELRETLLARRSQFVESCLSCDDKENTCQPKSFSARDRDEANLCKRLFWTPTEIQQPRPRTRLAGGPMSMVYTYDISAEGRIQNIKLNYFEGRNESAALRMLEQGARRNHYAPLVVNGIAYAIENLEGKYILQD